MKKVRIARRPGKGQRLFGVFSSDQLEIGSHDLGIGGKRRLPNGTPFWAYFFQRRRDAVAAAEAAGFEIEERTP